MVHLIPTDATSFIHFLTPSNLDTPTLPSSYFSTIPISQALIIVNTSFEFSSSSISPSSSTSHPSSPYHLTYPNPMPPSSSYLPHMYILIPQSFIPFSSPSFSHLSPLPTHHPLSLFLGLPSTMHKPYFPYLPPP